MQFTSGPRSIPSMIGIAAIALLAMLADAALASSIDLQSRFACHKALEEVRWQARIWPTENQTVRRNCSTRAAKPFPLWSQLQTLLPQRLGLRNRFTPGPVI